MKKTGVKCVSQKARRGIYLPLPVAALNFVTALVPSETACLASSPGRMRRTAVWSFEAASMKALVPVTIIIAVVGVVATVMDMINKIGDQKGAPFGCSTG